MHELTGEASWNAAAGGVGLALAALAVYTGWAFLVEGATKKTVLPVGRRGQGAVAVYGSLLEQMEGAPAEPGVRVQL